MDMHITLSGRRYRVKLDNPISLAIPLAFGGAQPSYFGAPRASAAPLAIGGFVGDTTQGGSCNVAELRLVPHCNGTHTESVGHIVGEAMPIAACLTRTLFPARVITVTPCPASQTQDSYRPAIQSDDWLITGDALESALRDLESDQIRALAVRSLPNDESKKYRSYGDSCPPPFFSQEAMRALIERGIEHVLVDIPSLDRTHDDGRLTNHHLFWNVPAESHALTAETKMSKTITEMIFVPNEVGDGCYLLDLQLPAFMCDAAPSRPVVYPLEPA
ncbi:MAG: cyclase family protein [Gammaproteobacteria bacterium]